MLVVPATVDNLYQKSLQSVWRNDELIKWAGANFFPLIQGDQKFFGKKIAQIF